MTNLTDTPENRTEAFAAAQAAHLTLPAQERAATRTAVWVEDGHVFWSGQWSGYSQPPEGEVFEWETRYPYSVFRDNPGWFGVEYVFDGEYTTGNGVECYVEYDAENETFWFNFASYEDWQRAEA